MSSTPTDHPLDNVIWRALTTVQADWSRGDALARRFRPAFARFAGMPARTGDALRALAADMAADEVLAVSDPDDFDPGPLFEVTDRKNLVQMVGPATGQARQPQRFRALHAADVPQMTALVQLTEPGPWFDRTHELGRFVGFEHDGQLVAMAGERMRVPGHTEISAVCCHPDWRGRGLAADLLRLVSQAIVARGETPFLHVLAENASAIGLYEKLGFRRRLQTRLTILRRNAAPLQPG
jgi:predicted GNAT family acetyltransferase